jgi:hypothetical protein
MDEDSVERLMEIILQMRIYLRRVTETFQLQTQEIRQQLEAIFETEKIGLQECLSGIDEKLADCAKCVEDYKKRHAALSDMRERLSMLGAGASLPPPALPAEQVEAVVIWRLQELRSQGKV